MAKHQEYWFKRRRYGWGWTPATWQGWLSILAFLSVVVGAGLQLPPKPQQPRGGELAGLFVILIGSTVILTLISYAKGPSPRWRWGKKPSDDPSEDI